MEWNLSGPESKFLEPDWDSEIHFLNIVPYAGDLN